MLNISSDISNEYDEELFPFGSIYINDKDIKTWKKKNLFIKHRNNGSIIQNSKKPRKKILSKRRKMSN